MNIDIINTQVAMQTGLPEAQVKLINSFYWRKIYEHLYSYDPQPLNIENICVLYPNKHLVKKFLLTHIGYLRNADHNKRYIEGSVKHQGYITRIKNLIAAAWQIRKTNKFTN